VLSGTHSSNANNKKYIKKLIINYNTQYLAVPDLQLGAKPVLLSTESLVLSLPRSVGTKFTATVTQQMAGSPTLIKSAKTRFPWSMPASSWLTTM
jgi:hypothetical protein